MDRETRFTLEILTVAVAISQIGQFVIQFHDPNLTELQRSQAILFGCIVAFVLAAGIYVLFFKRK